jgi:transcriptional regulator with XRE-family HTH domain
VKLKSKVLFRFDRKFSGNQLKEARERNHWTQADLAKRTGLPAAAISHWECGRRMPSLENLWTLLFVLRVSADDILGIVTLTSTQRNRLA